MINRNGILLPRTEFVETSPTRVDLAGTQPPVAAGEKIVVFVMAGSGVDTFAVKGDAADGTPSNLNDKLGNGSGLTKAVTGSPANSIVNLAVDHATAVPLQSTGAGSVGVATKSAREDHVHPAPAPGSPAVDEMKNATLIAQGSAIFVSLFSAVTLESWGIAGPGAPRFYWPAIDLTVNGVSTADCEPFIYWSGGTTPGVVASVFDMRITGVGANVLVRYRVYRIDET
jgi:hypothetical protein